MSHSVYALSSSYRWFEDACPASIRMSKPYPSMTSEAAEEGTAAHELREFCLRLGIRPEDCEGMEFNGFQVDDEMIQGASIDVNFINRLSIEYGVKPLLEQRVIMSGIGRDDVFGTADTVLVSLKQRILHISDFKYGRGVVEADGNRQLQGYAVSTLDTLKLWDKIDTIRTSIVQPRYNHTLGPIRTAEYNIAEINDIADAFYRSVNLADDVTVEPNAGTWCKYCPARGNCYARMMRTLKITHRRKPLFELTSDEIEELLTELPVVKTHLEAIELEGLRRARQGQRFELFKVVDSRPRATCTDEKGLIKAAVESGIKPERLYDKKLKSHSAAKKVLPGELLDKYYVAPPSTEILVPMSDKRVAKIKGYVPRGTFGQIKPRLEK